MLTADQKLAGEIREFVTQDAGGPPEPGRFPPDPFWQSLRDTGTELWLDTGDIQEARSLWNRSFSALTTNNTLLNAEVQKGIYDGLISDAAGMLSGLGERERVMEIAFILNARHGLNLVRAFGARVSVELHTDCARSVDMTLAFGRRFHQVSPDHFIVKVPLTPEGLIAARKLREEHIPVNCTLGFSARHNHLAALFAFPSYVNVFLGRLGSYVADNGLGDGLLVGERATLASQREVRQLRERTGREVRQIAASMRSPGQIRDLAGVDVFTMPVKVAREARERLEGSWSSMVDREYPVNLAPGVPPEQVRIHTLWAVSEAERELALSLDHSPPGGPEELVERAHQGGAGDLFPRMTREELDRIASDGKIPAHAAWAPRIQRGELAVDSLLNLAGLASFAESQAELDGRIRKLVSGRGA
ncbi:MAG: transaldolase family protein [Spirochaetota bacterium]